MSIHSSVFNQVKLRRSQIFIENLFIRTDKAPKERHMFFIFLIG